MKIVFFHAYPHQYAGAQRVTHAVASALPRFGLSGRVITVDDGPFPDRLRETGIEVEIVTAPRSWRRYGGALLDKKAAVPALATLPWYWRKLARALGDADLVHINDHRAMLLAGPAAKLARKPVVWHLHGPFRSRWINRFGGTIADRILVVSHDTLAAMPILSERFPGKVQVLHNGLPPLDRLALSQGEPAVPLDRPTVVCGARIHPDKGLDVLVHAAALLKARVPAVRFFVFGHVQRGYETHKAELDRLIANNGLAETMFFPGALENPLPTWQAATIYVQPSRAEPFGLGVLEAMAVGTPVIASRTGGLQEIVEPEKNGLLVEPEDPLALAGAIARLLDDPVLSARLAEDGKRRATVDFSQERMLSRLVEVYRGLGGERTRLALGSLEP